MKLKASTEWFGIEDELKAMGRKLRYNSDLYDLLHNVRDRVSDLSKEEVKARSHRSNRVDELLVLINDDIELIEEYLLIAILAG